MSTDLLEHQGTLYVAPGNSQCRVYFVPFVMRPGQHPADLAPRYQDRFVEIGLLNFQLEVVCLEPDFFNLREDIVGQMGGTSFAIRRGEEGGWQLA